jgi:hypothetical protein
MRVKPSSFLMIAIVIVVATFALNAAVTPNRTSLAAPAQETPAATAAAKCTDQKLIDSISADAKTIGDNLSKIPSTGAGGVYSIMISIANARIKYEDMDTPSDLACSYLVTETIILFSDVQDLGLINMGTKLGLDTSADTPTVTDRLNKQVKKVNDLIGVAASS